MNSKENPDDFFETFQKQLEESQSWPGLYMFKFIVKSNSRQIDKIKDLFNNPKEVVSLVNSSKNKFQSLTIKIEMNSPQQVIAIYKTVSELEGVIIL
jgi:putative lipoic acid-binding regulatory protein